MVKLVQKGDFSKAMEFFKRLTHIQLDSFDKYGAEGVQSLSAATPVRTGLTASSWDYKITRSNGTITIEWLNTNVNAGVNIAVILQYGHGTGTGGYVRGIDYINPALQPIFEKIADEAWREVTGK